MAIFSDFQTKKICYNSNILRKRSIMIFDIDSEMEASGQSRFQFSGHRPSVGGGARFYRCASSIGERQNPREQGTGRILSEMFPVGSRGAAETRPTPAVSTQQRIGFRGKAANFPKRKTGYGGASRDNHAAYPFFSFFVWVLSGTFHETDLEDAPLFSAPKRPQI
jgi:hypothetical protein